MKNYSQATREFINSQTDESYTGEYTLNNKEENYKIKIIYRGEHLLYQEKFRSTICEMEPRNAVVFKMTIENWDNGSEILEHEKEIIIDRIEFFFKKIQGREDVKIV